MVAKKLFAGVSTVALVGSGAASALAQPAFNWTGPYMGAHGGYGFGAFTDGAECTNDYGDVYSVFMLVENPGDDLDQVGACWWNLFATSLDPDQEDIEEDHPFSDAYFVSEVFEDLPATAAGFLAGVQLGYRLQVPGGAVVFGAEVAHSLTTIQQTHGNYAWGYNFADFGDGVEKSFFDLSITGVLSLDSLTTATAQLGFAIGRALIYGEGGAAMGQFSYTNSLGFNGQATAFGYVFGGGIEVRVADRVSLFAEYNRVQFNNVMMLGQSNVLQEDWDTGDYETLNQHPSAVYFNFGANIIKAGFNIGL